MSILKEHFNELLLAALLLVLTGVTIAILAHEGWQSASDGFKWASNLVSGLLGALLALLMKQQPKDPPVVKP